MGVERECVIPAGRQRLSYALSGQVVQGWAVLKLVHVGLKDNAMELIAILKENPFKNPQPYEKLQGDLTGFYSRRINIRHRLVYQVFEEEKTVKVVRMWTP